VDTLRLLLHPARMRLVHAMSGGRTRTTSDLCASLPDVSKATVYRHVGLLAEAGLLEVAGEQRVHGAVERRYRLNRARAVTDQGAAAAMSLEEHRYGFAAAVAALVAEFNAYLDREGADPTADLVGYRQVPLWLNRDELAALIGEMRRIIVSRTDNEPAADRSLYLLSPIIFPIEAPAQDRAGKQTDRPVTGESRPLAQGADGEPVRRGDMPESTQQGGSG
jgi:DNA-binding transcriptional ArsR family regulator